jgi:hypothetical protein
VVAQFEHERAFFRRGVHRELQQPAEQRFLAGRRRPEQDVHEDRSARRKLARLERFGLAIIRDYIAEFVFLIQVHDMPPEQ